MVAGGIKQQDLTTPSGDYRARETGTLRPSDYKSQAVQKGFGILEKFAFDYLEKREENRIQGAVNRI